MLAVPFVPLPLNAWQKAAVAGALFVLTQISFYAGVLLVGKDVIYRYLKRLWPWGRKRSTAELPESEQENGDQSGAEPPLRAGDEHHGTVEDHEGKEDAN